MANWDISDSERLPAVAAAILARVEAAATERAVVLALHGDLGTGKTTFMQTLAAALGVTETVSSPTFVVMKQYETRHTQFSELVHIDAYRIESIDEMRVLGFRELLQQKNIMIGIEWAERIGELLPADTLHLTFTLAAEGTRTLRCTHGQDS